ncbi:MAG TPA: hypothetical protein VFP47_03245 [Pyrinomonadaceae bacterium]|nr:hypothetical protein [Pyrinomonadaceae bacterium]
MSHRFKDVLVVGIGSGRRGPRSPGIIQRGFWDILKRIKPAELLISPLDGNFDGQRRLATI